MPHIKPFSGIRPAREYAGRVVASPRETPFNETSGEVLRANPFSFLHLVEPELGNIYLQGSREALVYRQVSENLQAFLEKGYLLKEEKPCLYLYSVEGRDHIRTGIWTVTLFDDYLSNHVRKHEYTRIDRETKISDYIRHTGIDANPVLIAYQADEIIDYFINKNLQKEPVLSFRKDDALHALRKIDEEADIRMIVKRFEEMPAAYLADGHHRAAAFSSYGVERRKFNFKHTGEEEYNFFSSVYFAAAALEIKAFSRLVKDLNGLSSSEFLQSLAGHFQLRKTEAPPALRKQTFGMYLDGQWYLLQPLEQPSGADPVKQLDVSILQDRVLGPLLGISDPRTDKRLQFAGGNLSPASLARQIDEKEAAVLFSLFPMSAEELMAVADAGLVMPPKSTWFEPKLDLGILTHYID
ncbi:MAG TPA: DUF1015 family protein [Anseongella sp.]|nr:DUF1015 family protein [Anseongella sp.]